MTHIIGKGLRASIARVVKEELLALLRSDYQIQEEIRFLTNSNGGRPISVDAVAKRVLDKITEELK
jgi:hypothetical protein